MTTVAALHHDYLRRLLILCTPQLQGSAMSIHEAERYRSTVAIARCSSWSYNGSVRTEPSCSSRIHCEQFLPMFFKTVHATNSAMSVCQSQQMFQVEKNTCIYYGINNQKFCNKYHYSTKFSCLTFVLLIFCSSSKCVVQIWWIVAKLREISIDVEDSTDVGGSATFCKRNQTVNKAT